MGDKEGGGRRGIEALPEKDTRGRRKPGVQGEDEERRGDTGVRGDRSASAPCPLRSTGNEVAKWEPEPLCRESPGARPQPHASSAGHKRRPDQQWPDQVPEPLTGSCADSTWC